MYPGPICKEIMSEAKEHLPAVADLIDEDYFAEFVTSCTAYNSAKESACMTDKVTKSMGKCCGKAAGDSFCHFLEGMCKNLDSYVPGEGWPAKEAMKEGCDGYCDEVSSKPDWCPSGLSAGAIAGIVIGGVVVVGVVAGVLVYFLIIKKRQIGNVPGGG
jgi:hypothetical protein